MEAIPLTEKSAAPSIAEIVDIIGAAATRTLCDKLGGISLELGDRDGLVAAAIGAEATAALRAYWGRGRIYVPRQPVSKSARHAEIRRLRKGGMGVQAIAKHVGITERQTYNCGEVRHSGRGRVAAESP